MAPRSQAWCCQWGRDCCLLSGVLKRCSWLAVHVSLAFPLVAGILFIPAVANLLLASFTDPGILHRGAEGQAELVIQALRVKESRFDLHWCQKCRYYCPPRTFHCPWCNVCVEEFDHHCKWLNNCIGCRNFRFFFLFVAFLCSYNVVVLASCITYLVLNFHQAYGAEKICVFARRAERIPSTWDGPGTGTRPCVPHRDQRLRTQGGLTGVGCGTSTGAGLKISRQQVPLQQPCDELGPFRRPERHPEAVGRQPLGRCGPQRAVLRRNGTGANQNLAAH
ncbi:Putative palmitoyltransferase ZDHHC19 [Chelonia mydas]|uniref:Palmitoyltransferase n=1 Tax=Chelonia mydas TaxID=8469 RepID=M7BPJ8_CHEMY|nr:Putative palmitoyltransferase ZDHHC19 [Chelonia mydas]